MGPIFQLVARAGVVAVTVALFLGAWGGLGQAQLMCVGGPSEFVCSGTEDEGVDVGQEWDDDTSITFTNVAITNVLGPDAIYNIDGHYVLITPGEDGQALIHISGSWAEVAGVSATGDGQGVIVNEGRIEVENTSNFAAGIRLGTVAIGGDEAANKTVVNFGEIDVQGAMWADGIAAYGDGHALFNHGSIVATGDEATGIYAEADPDAEDPQSVQISNSGVINATGESSAYGILAYDYTGDGFFIYNGGNGEGTGEPALITSTGRDAWGIHVSGFSETRGLTATIWNDGDMDVTGTNLALGIQTLGYEAVVENRGSINVSVAGDEESGLFAVAGGIMVGGDSASITNTGTITVDVSGPAGVIGAGIVVVPDPRPEETSILSAGTGATVVTNSGSLSVTATSIGDEDPETVDGLALALGMGAVGKDIVLENQQGGELDVYAEGRIGVAGGMAALGETNTVENYGDVTAGAWGQVGAVALGLGSFDPEGSQVHNHGSVSVEAVAGMAGVGVGMASAGTGNSLVNSEDATLDVSGVGIGIGAGVGMAVVGVDNEAVNEGEASVEGRALFGVGVGVGVGMVGLGDGNALHNAGDSSFEVSAEGRLAVAGGMLVSGIGEDPEDIFSASNSASNAGYLHVVAKGVEDPGDPDTDLPAAALAVGMLGVGTGTALENAAGGELDVYADGDFDSPIALAAGMAVLGGANTVENRGSVVVTAEHGDTAVALGLASHDIGAGGSVVHNHETLSVTATGTQGLAIGLGSLDVGAGGSTVQNDGDVTVRAVGLPGPAAAVGMVGAGTGGTVENHEDASVDVTAFGLLGAGVGMVVAGDDNAAANEGDVTVVGGGVIGIGAGMVALGDGNALHNAAGGELNVTGQGHLAVAGGMVVSGIGEEPEDFIFASNTASNAGHVHVTAVSTPALDPDKLPPVAVAVGMLGIGMDTSLENEAGAELEVTASGPLALAAGMAALGTGNTVENFGEVSVNAEAADIALAVGLASMARGDAGNTVQNHGRVDVSAYGVGGFEAEFAAAVGMVGLGTGNELENGEGSTLWVRAAGENAIAGGMLVVGQDNTIHNAGTVDVMAQGQGFAASVGLVAVDLDLEPDDDPAVSSAAADEQPALRNDGDVEVMATGNVALALGMGVLGEDNTVENAERVSVQAHGTEGALALGLAGIDAGDGGTSLHNHGMVEAVASADMATGTALSAGMVGIGTAGALENGETGFVHVSAYGSNALAAGMVVAGQDSAAANEGTVSVSASGADFAAAAGLLAVSGSFDPENEPVVPQVDSGGYVYTLLNDEDGQVGVYASADIAAAIGMGVLGEGNTAENYGGLVVTAHGNQAAVALGMGAVELGEGGSALHNHGSLTVTAEGLVGGTTKFAAALGMAGLGTGIELENAEGADLNVKAFGTVAAGAGIAALGTGNMVENYGDVNVTAEGMGAAAALGLAALDLGDEKTTVHNHGSVDVDASALPGSHVAAAGMAGIGTGVALVNTDGASLDVLGFAGTGDALAAGMLVVGEDNTIDNAGEVEVAALGARYAVAVGLAAVDSDCFCDEDEPVTLLAPADQVADVRNDGEGVVSVRGAAETAAALGMGVAGVGYGAENDGTVAVEADGGEAAVAVGLGSFGLGNTLYNEGTAKVVTHGTAGFDPELAAAVGMAGIGAGSSVENVGDGSIVVSASGVDALAAGIILVGEGNTGYNQGTVKADAEGTTGVAVAVGLASVELDLDPEDGPAGLETVTVDVPALQNDGMVAATAVGNVGIAVGMGAIGEGNVVGNYDAVEATAEGTHASLAIGLAVADLGDGGSELHNYGEVVVDASASQEESEWAVAAGMAGIGTGVTLRNAGGAELDVTGFGNNALAAGMLAVGEGNTAHNAGNVNVGAVATGHAVAIGLASVDTGLGGDDPELVNDGGAKVEASATADVAAALGMVVLGDYNTAENYGELLAEASGGEMAVAVGLAAVDKSGAGSTLYNRGEATVVAQGVGDFDTDFAAAVGMVGLGVNNEVANAEDGMLHVTSDGLISTGVGMASVGTSNIVKNTGDVEVAAKGDVFALALGLAGVDSGDGATTVYNDGSTAVAAAVEADDGLAAAVGMAGIGTAAALQNLEDGFLMATAFGADAVAAGLVVAGEDNTAHNMGDAHAVAIGDTSAVAVGMAALDIDFGGDEPAGMQPAAAVGPALQNDEFVHAVATADMAAALGMVLYGEDDTAENYGSLEVAAQGDELALAVGMGGIGSGHILENTTGGTLSVTAEGSNALAAGVVALGIGNKATNAGEIHVSVEAVSAGESGPVDAKALADASADRPDWLEWLEGLVGEIDGVAAVGMIGSGEGNSLENEEGGTVTVEARGDGAGATGMGLIGIDGEVLNSGSLRVSVEGNHQEYDWLAGAGLLASGKDNTLTNSGSIVVEAEGDMVSVAGIVSSGLGNQVHNAHEIEVHSGALGDSEDEWMAPEAYGILAEGRDVKVENAGPSGANIDVVAEGPSALAMGIYVDGTGDSEIRNLGNIYVSGYGDGSRAYGIGVLASDGTVTVENDVLVKISGELERSVGVGLMAINVPSAQEGTAILNNRGEIQAANTAENGFAAGVRVGGPEGNTVPLGTVEIRNERGGYIGAVAKDAYAIYVDELGADHKLVKVVNEGTLAEDVVLRGRETEIELHDESETFGDVWLKGGTNKAVVYAGADLVDDTGRKYQLIGGEDGFDILVLTIDVEGPYHSGNMQGHMVNFDKVDIVAGEWRIEQEGLGDQETIVREHSTLVLTETLVLGPNGRVGGNGRIQLEDGATLVNDRGTVAPGESIGTLTIDGDYINEPDGVLEVEIQAQDPKADLLVVNGTATLNGGTVEVLPEDSVANYRKRTITYDIVKADRIDGQFTGAVTSSPFLKARLDDRSAGASDYVILEVQGLDAADVARTPNEKSVGQILDTLPNDDALVRALYALSTQSAVESALNSLSGEVYTAFPVVSVATIDRFAQAVLRGMDDPDAEDGRRGWVTAYGTSGKLKGNDENAGADVKVAGGAAGMHVLTGPNGRVGVTAGFAHSKVSMKARNSALTGDGYQMGMYGRYDMGTVRMTGLLVHSRSRYDGERGIHFGAGGDRFSRVAQGKFDGTQMLASLRGEWLVSGHGAAEIQPMFGLSWLRTSRNGFTEQGAEGATLHVDSYATSYLRGDLGVRIAMRTVETRSGWHLNPALRLAYVHDFSAPSRDIRVRLAANPDESRTIRGIEHAKSGFQVGLGLSGYRGGDDRFGWNLRYDGEFRSDVQTHTVLGGLNVRF